jgi:integrase
MQPQPKCPECSSKLLYRDGLRYLNDGSQTQRWLCRNCGYRFTESNVKANITSQILKVSNPGKNHANRRITRPNFSREEVVDGFPFNGSEQIGSHDVSSVGKRLNALRIYNSEYRVCATREGAKNLETATETKTVAGETQKVSIEAQIVNYLIYLKNEGRRDATIEAKDFQLRRLIQLGANLNNPESVKRVIADLDKSESYKLLLCIAYEGFAKKNGITWARPSYKQVDKLPFVPHESEIDALIAGCGKKTATLLRLLKETAMRLGEAWQIEWKDFDAQNRTITCNHPEKNSRARAFNISVELTQMLQSLSVNSQYIFTCSRQPIGKENPKVHMHNLKRQKGLLGHQRLRVAHKLKNPRIAQIHYHSLRHWKATHLKHQGFDLFDIAAFLGHRSIKNTVLYVHLEKTCYPNGGDDYHSKAARTEAETLSLIEAGFEYVCDFEGVKLFRKRK